MQGSFVGLSGLNMLASHAWVQVPSMRVKSWALQHMLVIPRSACQLVSSNWGAPRPGERPCLKKTKVDSTCRVTSGANFWPLRIGTHDPTHRCACCMHYVVGFLAKAALASSFPFTLILLLPWDATSWRPCLDTNLISRKNVSYFVFVCKNQSSGPTSSVLATRKEWGYWLKRWQTPSPVRPSEQSRWHALTH